MRGTPRVQTEHEQGAFGFKYSCNFCRKPDRIARSLERASGENQRDAFVGQRQRRFAATQIAIETVAIALQMQACVQVRRRKRITSFHMRLDEQAVAATAARDIRCRIAVATLQ